MPILDDYVEQIWLNGGPGGVSESRLTHIELGLGDVTSRVKGIEELNLPTAAGGVATWAGTQRFTAALYGDQSTPQGVYPSVDGGVPGINLADGTNDWRLDNNAGSLRFLKAGVASVATLDFAGTFTTKSLVGTTVNAGKTPVPRQPNGYFITYDGAGFTSASPADKVALPLTVTFKGGFANETGWSMPNASFLFGANDFIVTGTAGGDVAGITDLFGRLTEVHLQTPSAAVVALVGHQSESNIAPSAVGSSVATMFSHRVLGPRVHAGTVANATSLFVGAPVVDGTGAVSGTSRALHVDGDSYLKGNTIVQGTLQLDLSTASSASPGVGFAPPSNVDGYLVVQVQGSSKRIPFYKP